MDWVILFATNNSDFQPLFTKYDLALDHAEELPIQPCTKTTGYLDVDSNEGTASVLELVLPFLTVTVQFEYTPLANVHVTLFCPTTAAVLSAVPQLPLYTTVPSESELKI